MMTTEWKDLPTLQDVACAQADGWDIERSNNNQFWECWTREVWTMHTFYRGRSRQPKMKKVKLLGWFDGEELRLAHEALQHDWVRVPSEDKEIEAPE
jgi:hypothetical protein